MISSTNNDDLTKLEGVTLTRGKGLCVLEAVSWLAGEPFSDAPSCVPATVRSAAIRLNDAIKDDTQRTKTLLPLVPLMFGLDDSLEHERARAFAAADWVLHKTTPEVLDLLAWSDLAEQIRALPAIVDRETSRAAHAAMVPIRKECWRRRKASAADADAYAAAYAAADAAAAYAAADAADAYAARETAIAVRDAIYASTAAMIAHLCTLGRVG